MDQALAVPHGSAGLTGQAMEKWGAKKVRRNAEVERKRVGGGGGMGRDGFHHKVPLDFSKETRGEVVEFFEKV